MNKTDLIQNANIKVRKIIAKFNKKENMRFLKSGKFQDGYWSGYNIMQSLDLILYSGKIYLYFQDYMVIESLLIDNPPIPSDKVLEFQGFMTHLISEGIVMPDEVLRDYLQALDEIESELMDLTERLKNGQEH